MPLWLKLTWYNDEPLRLDMNKIESYYKTTENNANTSLAINGESFQVKETLEEIDAAMSNPNHSFRLQPAGGWK